MNSTHCPACQRDIGVWSLFSAPLPTRIRCPHCNARLAFNPSGWKMVIVALVVLLPIYAATGFWCFRHSPLDPITTIALWFMFLVASWIGAEAIFVYRLRTRYELRLIA